VRAARAGIVRVRRREEEREERRRGKDLSGEVTDELLTSLKERSELSSEHSLHPLGHLLDSSSSCSAFALQRGGQSCTRRVLGGLDDLCRHAVKDLLELMQQSDELLVVFLRMSALELIVLERDPD
jgi:hypothetical protein